jgi:hypothetical protein
MEQYRKILDLFNRDDEMCKLTAFTDKLLNQDVRYKDYKESFYRILELAKKYTGLHIPGINDLEKGQTIEDCLYEMCEFHKAIGFATGLALGNFIVPFDKEIGIALKALLDQLIESGIIQYGPREMLTHEVETKPTHLSSV